MEEGRKGETMVNVQNSFFIDYYFVGFMKQQIMWQAVRSMAVRLCTCICMHRRRKVKSAF